MFFWAGYWYLSLSGHIVVGDVGYDRLDLEMERCDLVDHGEPEQPRIYGNWYIWWFPKMVGFPNNHGFFLLKMIILGCFGGTPISGNTHICT